MSLEVVGFYRDIEDLHDECKKCISYYSIIILSNGARVEGIVETVDDDNVSMLVAEEVVEGDYEDEMMNRQKNMGDRQQGRFRRFRRRNFPIRNVDRARPLRFPFIVPLYPVYPYPYPFYPY